MVGMVLLLGSTAGLALAAEAVTNVLVVHRIAVQPGGTEAAEPAAAARPGDVLEYKALFHNNGSTVAHGLSATLPLPVGTEFLPGSQQPAAALASTDGAIFEALPLKRVVKAADGSSHEEVVPAREYRYLRWAGTDLPGSGDLAVSARVRIAGVTAAP
jgi:uncharacterized repeat protein (TIGR01451 family)